MQIEIGTRLDGAPGPKYRAALRFAELAPSTGLPKPAKLQPWCASDEHGAFAASLVAPPSLIFDEQSRPHVPQTRSVFDRLATACDALKARFLLLETGASLSPSLRDRDRFVRYCETLSKTPGCPQLVWRAGGLWEGDDVLALCAEHDLWMACDPFADDLPDEELPAASCLYLQARAEGATRRFGEDHFIRLARQIEAAPQLDELVITLDSAKAFREVRRLQALFVEFGLLEPSQLPADSMR